MKLTKFLIMQIAAFGFIFGTIACQKKDESKPIPQLVPQGSDKPNPDTKKPEVRTATPESTPEKEKEKKPALDTSQAKLAILKRDEVAFLQKLFTTIFEAEFRSKNFEDIANSDLGILSSAKLTTVDQTKSNLEVKLHFVSQNAIASFKGEIKSGEIATLKNENLTTINVRAACADDKCDLIIGYASESLKDDKNQMLGTFIFKRSGDEHLSVKINDQETDEEKQNFAILRVEKNLLQGIETFGGQIVENLKKKIKEEGSWYSPYPFVTNLVSERTDLKMNQDGTIEFNLKQMFNTGMVTTRLKDYSLDFKGEIGAPIIATDSMQNLEVTWTQVTKTFGYAIFKTDKYISNRDAEKKERTAYFIKWCGFESVTINNVTVILDKCDYKASTEFLGSKKENGEIEFGKDEGGIE